MFSSVIERVFIGHPFVSPSLRVLAVSLTITFVVPYSSLVSLECGSSVLLSGWVLYGEASGCYVTINSKWVPLARGK